MPDALLDRELITELARRAHFAPAEVARLDEHPRSFIAQLMKAFWRGSIETWSAPPPADVVDEDYLAKLSAMVIEEAADLGHCVIVGRETSLAARGGTSGISCKAGDGAGRAISQSIWQRRRRFEFCKADSDLSDA